MGAVPSARRRQPHRHEGPASRARRRARPSSAPTRAARAGTVSRGPVFSEFNVAHPFGKKGSFATTVRLYNGLRRIDIRTRIVNDETFVRYRVLFPTSIRDGQDVHEIPFGAIRRPDGIEFPAQNWIDYGDGQKGVALLNRGLPGNNVADGTMMLSLLRSTRIVSYGDASGGYGAGTDASFELGKELAFDYALVPHAGDWRAGGRLSRRDGIQSSAAGLPDGLAPRQTAQAWGLLEITPHNVVVSALKPGPDGTAVLRVYEAAGQATDAKIRLSAQVAAAEEVNLMEDPGRKLPVADKHCNSISGRSRSRRSNCDCSRHVKRRQAFSGKRSADQRPAVAR